MSTATVSALAILLAFGLDLWRGEPPARFHPVVWMGQYLERAGRLIAPVFITVRNPGDVHASGPTSPAGRLEMPDPTVASGLRSDAVAPARYETARHEAARHEADCGGAVALDAPSVQYSARRQFLAGAVAWLLGAMVCTLAASLLQWSIFQLPGWMAAPLLALCLKPLFAWAMLRDLVVRTETALQQGLDVGRTQLAHLVSRNVHELDAAGVRESAIETLAENLSDSVVAPLFWFVLFGLPGAALYRFANTADAMWGYPGERGGRWWQWAGKWAARADDVLNWLPARLTAALLMLGAPAALWRRLPTEACRTPSPNSGWPMSAMALRLGITLGKPGVYRLNDVAPQPESAHTPWAIRKAQRVAGMAVLLGMFALVLQSMI